MTLHGSYTHLDDETLFKVSGPSTHRTGSTHRLIRVTRPQPCQRGGGLFPKTGLTEAKSLGVPFGAPSPVPTRGGARSTTGSRKGRSPTPSSAWVGRGGEQGNVRESPHHSAKIVGWTRLQRGFVRRTGPAAPRTICGF